MSDIVERLKAEEIRCQKLHDVIVEKRDLHRGTSAFSDFNSIKHALAGRDPVLEEAANEIVKIRADRDDAHARGMRLAGLLGDRAVKDIIDENTRLRAALAMSDRPCAYCSLPAEEWSKCQSGFPGCSRADDAMGCPHLGSAMELASIKAKEKSDADESAIASDAGSV